MPLEENGRPVATAEQIPAKNEASRGRTGRKSSNDPEGQSRRRRRVRELGGPGGAVTGARPVAWTPPESMVTRKKMSRRRAGMENENRRSSVAEIRHRGRTGERKARIGTNYEVPVPAEETEEADQQEPRPGRRQEPGERAVEVLG